MIWTKTLSRYRLTLHSSIRDRLQIYMEGIRSHAYHEPHTIYIINFVFDREPLIRFTADADQVEYWNRWREMAKKEPFTVAYHDDPVEWQRQSEARRLKIETSLNYDNLYNAKDVLSVMTTLSTTLDPNDILANPKSHSNLLIAFSLLDRRVGTRTLKKIEDSINLNNDLTRTFYDLRTRTK